MQLTNVVLTVSPPKHRRTDATCRDSADVHALAHAGGAHWRTRTPHVKFRFRVNYGRYLPQARFAYVTGSVIRVDGGMIRSL
jgi:hypothetical protein